MQQNNTILVQSIAQAIRNGKSQDAIKAYTQAISEGIHIKFNFKAALADEHQFQNIIQKAPPKKEHPIIKATKFVVQNSDKAMGNLQSDRNSGAKPALGKIDINKIPLNLPIVSNEIVSFRGEFVFFNEPVQSADPDAVISHLQTFYKNRKI